MADLNAAEKWINEQADKDHDPKLTAISQAMRGDATANEPGALMLKPRLEAMEKRFDDLDIKLELLLEMKAKE